ncbi:DUF3883 domain-containing protein [Mangrovibacter sp. SLW1]
MPSYGYDYLSFNAPGHERYIEVKSVGREKRRILSILSFRK